jgi:hypothetical protein
MPSLPGLMTKLGALARFGRLISQAAAHPTVFHITHHKAGSQWINRILHALAFDRIVSSEVDVAHFLARPIQAGKIYPTLYVTKEQFESVKVPRDSRRFVVVRDLRDTLVSAYFSFRNSHPYTNVYYQNLRERLIELDREAGMIFLAETWLTKPAQVQWSWVAAGEPIIRYEELLSRDEEILERVLLSQCRLPIRRQKLREVILANRFEARSGRKRGSEDVNSHERKGVSGDWRNHFTDRIAKSVKEWYGSLLIAAGYEKGFDW